jgi:hypothetical protein
MRAISRQALDKLNLQTTGMEFASEMIVKAAKNKLKISQLPIKYHQRVGKSKLHTFSDGWKHLRFMLIYSPMFLFFIPGIILLLLGLESMAWFYFGNPEILGRRLVYHPMFLSSLFIIIGYQLILFAAFTRTYATTHLGERAILSERFYKFFSLERAIFFGKIISLIGIAIYLFIFIKWVRTGFGALEEVKNGIVGLTLLTIGIQTIFSAFMLSILGIKEK